MNIRGPILGIRRAYNEQPTIFGDVYWGGFSETPKDPRARLLQCCKDSFAGMLCRRLSFRTEGSSNVVAL